MKKLQWIVSLAALTLFVSAQAIFACPGTGNKDMGSDSKPKDAKNLMIPVQ